MITPMATDHDATTPPTDTDGAGGATVERHAAPGEDLAAPNGTPAGPVETDQLAADEVAEAAPAETVVREFADVEWQMPFWSRKVGHVERLELTETVRGAVDNGKLTILGEVEHVADTPPRARRAKRG